MYKTRRAGGARLQSTPKLELFHKFHAHLTKKEVGIIRKNGFKWLIITLAAHLDAAIAIKVVVGQLQF